MYLKIILEHSFDIIKLFVKGTLYESSYGLQTQHKIGIFRKSAKIAPIFLQILLRKCCFKSKNVMCVVVALIN